MWDCHTTLPQRIDLALNGCLRNWRLRTRLGRSHRQIRKIVKPPWCAVPTRGVGGIVNSKVLFRRHAVKPNVTELRSHKGSWQIQPRNSRWLASVVGKTHRNASANLFWAFVMPALRIIDTPSDSHKGHYVNPHRWVVGTTFEWQFVLPIPGRRQHTPETHKPWVSPRPTRPCV